MIFTKYSKSEHFDGNWVIPSACTRIERKTCISTWQKDLCPMLVQLIFAQHSPYTL
jgi:hypothetical protein